MTKVVVYGSLKAGFGNSHLLDGVACLDNDVKFMGTMASLGGYPCVSQHGDTVIHGELYEVDDATLARLDRLEGHPRYYERKIVHTSAGDAWIYLIDDQSYYADGARIVKDGRWTESWRNAA